MEQAVGGAIRGALSGIFKVLFPPLALASLVDEGGVSDLPAFKPIIFSKGKSELDEVGKAFADQLAHLLTERPKLSLRVCGRTSAKDFDAYLARQSTNAISADAPSQGETTQESALIQAGHNNIDDVALSDMMALANARTIALRRYMVKEKLIDTERIDECREIFDPNDQAPPRVIITW